MSNMKQLTYTKVSKSAVLVLERMRLILLIADRHIAARNIA